MPGLFLPLNKLELYVHLKLFVSFRKMAIIGASDDGFLVDHKKSISDSVAEQSLACKDYLFALFEPYFRSSDETGRGTRKRKRKKSAMHAASEEEIDACIFHNKDSTIGKNLFDHMICHHEDTPMLLNISGQKYVLPSNCSFLLSDASNLSPLLDYAKQNGRYNLVVLDPPWFNKSAKRGSKYSFMSLWDIKSLPVPHLVAPGAIVGVWVTNKQKYLRFTKSELFPHWSVELVAEWFWAKVTRRGELVTELDSPHKRPYEPLLIGRFQPMMKLLRSESLNSGKDLKDIDSCPGMDLLLNSQKRRKISLSPNFENIGTISLDGTHRTVSSSTNESEMTNRESDVRCTECTKGKTDPSNALLGVKTPRSSNLHGLDCEELVDIVTRDVPANSRSKHVDKQSTRNQTKGKIIGQSAREISETGLPLNLEEGDRDNKPSKSQSEILQTVFDGCINLPYHQVICSVPYILEKYVPPQPLCLEMFARNLTPNWTSWGNEVLKFQHVDYFDQLTPKDE
ncbi:N(6)-adenine-specific methyltransferase METTL4 [Acropora cervicornis]|uniref:N(6)-adenine-specific methyltransferase METTL4 n=1 Tax=Acropora cervicornis TaxID=6130 RepID=A0AAD9PUR8_ACRCE|nr:N(6)-adenine-specific methyltransferase METTL4 [Acropora cervicornis]